MFNEATQASKQVILSFFVGKSETAFARGLVVGLLVLVNRSNNVTTLLSCIITGLR